MKKKNLLLTGIAIFGLLATTISQTLPSYVPTEGLVSWLSFNGNANDESGNENNGTVNGATLCADRYGSVNSAYSFDGLSNVIDFSNSPTQNIDNFSMSGWISPSVLNQGRGTIVLMGVDDLIGGSPSLNGVSICIGGSSSGVIDNCINGAVSDFQMLSSNFYIPTINTWYFFVFIRDNGIYKMYIDNISILNKSGETPRIPTDLKIGSATDDGFFNGKIDDVGIWDRVLTQQEITDLYSSSVGINKEIVQNMFKVYPNPTAHQFNVQVNTSFVGSTYLIQDPLGKTVLSGELKTENSTLEFGSLPSGMYIFSVEKNNTKQSIKVIIN